MQPILHLFSFLSIVKLRGPQKASAPYCLCSCCRARGEKINQPQLRNACRATVFFCALSSKCFLRTPHSDVNLAQFIAPLPSTQEFKIQKKSTSVRCTDANAPNNTFFTYNSMNTTAKTEAAVMP
jgi:hypothetical protein